MSRSTIVATTPATGQPPAARTPEQLAAAGLKAFFLIADRWRLSTDEAMTLLGRPARTTFYRWRRGEAVGITPDLLERLSHLIGIQQALATLFPEPARADAWPRRPNSAPLFGGAPAMDRLLAGGVSDLWVVRQYLAAEAAGAGGW